MDIRVNNIISELANQYGTTPEQIKGISREAHIVLARQHAMYMIKTQLGFTLSETGNIFDRDHSTVIHSIRRYLEYELDKNIKYTEDEKKFIASLIAEKHRLWHKMRDVDSLLRLYQR